MYGHNDGKPIVYLNNIRYTSHTNTTLSLKPRLFIYEFNKPFYNKPNIHLNAISWWNRISTKNMYYILRLRIIIFICHISTRAIEHSMLNVEKYAISSLFSDK